MKVVVGMSGGVDSSVAAALLKERGHEVSGITMKIWDGQARPGNGLRHGCYGPGEDEDIEDARRVASILGIDFHVFDLRQEYQSEVLDYFSQEYLSGRTPNPCFKCNRKVKFDALLKKTQDSGINFDYFATGHYTRVEYNKNTSRYLLIKAKDLKKDQTYFISSLSQKQLSRSLFPLGEYTKDEVKKIAVDFGLGVDNKPESQDFFDGEYASLVGSAPPGPILDKEGKRWGEHRGIQFYTVGQRKGLGISSKEPLYVTDIDQENNAIIIGSSEEVYRDELIASGLNWIAIEELRQPIDVKARIRYLHKEADATVTPLSEGNVHVKFREPQKAITPGQTVVFYQSDIVVGAGIIERQRL